MKVIATLLSVATAAHAFQVKVESTTSTTEGVSPNPDNNGVYVYSNPNAGQLLKGVFDVFQHAMEEQGESEDGQAPLAEASHPLANMFGHFGEQQHMFGLPQHAMEEPRSANSQAPLAGASHPLANMFGHFGEQQHMFGLPQHAMEEPGSANSQVSLADASHPLANLFGHFGEQQHMFGLPQHAMEGQGDANSQASLADASHPLANMFGHFGEQQYMYGLPQSKIDEEDSHSEQRKRQGKGKGKHRKHHGKGRRHHVQESEAREVEPEAFINAVSTLFGEQPSAAQPTLEHPNESSMRSLFKAFSSLVLSGMTSETPKAVVETATFDETSGRETITLQVSEPVSFEVLLGSQGEVIVPPFGHKDENLIHLVDQSGEEVPGEPTKVVVCGAEETKCTIVHQRMGLNCILESCVKFPRKPETMEAMMREAPVSPAQPVEMSENAVEQLGGGAIAAIVVASLVLLVAVGVGVSKNCKKGSTGDEAEVDAPAFAVQYAPPQVPPMIVQTTDTTVPFQEVEGGVQSSQAEIAVV